MANNDFRDLPDFCNKNLALVPFSKNVKNSYKYKENLKIRNKAMLKFRLIKIQKLRNLNIYLNVKKLKLPHGYQ